MAHARDHLGRLLLPLAAGAAGLCVAAMPGCDYMAAAAYVIEGPPKVERQFELDDTKKVVVFVDDRSGTMPRKGLRRVIGQTAEETLLAEKALKAELVIPSAAAIAAVTQEKRGEPLSVVEVGRTVGADVVVYVNVEKFTLSRDGVGAGNQPFAVAYVKVFDTASNRRIWPPESLGKPIMYTAAAGTQAPETLGERAKAEDALAKRLGLEVARLFFTYERDGASKRGTQL